MIFYNRKQFSPYTEKTKEGRHGIMVKGRDIKKQDPQCTVGTGAEAKALIPP